MSEATMQQDERPLFRLQTPALIAGSIAAAACVAGAFLSFDQFIRSYLVAFLVVAGIAVGSLMVLMLQYLTGGWWSILIRATLGAASRTLPLVALFFLPIALSLPRLYAWARPDAVAHSELLQHKAPYLNVTFFLIRGAIYFLIWIGAMALVDRWARRLEDTSSPWMALRLRQLSAAGLLLMALTLTFASIDWIMSLEAEWYSTMFGISYIIGNGLSAFAFAIVILVRLSDRSPVSDVIRPSYFRDLGNLMFAFVMLWAYTAFSQFLLIWYANLREEVTWYLKRITGGWGIVALVLIVFHFFLPFFVLLLRAVKDRPRLLGTVAMLVLFMRIVDMTWLIIPSFQEMGHGSHVVHAAAHWTLPFAVIALGGIWFFFFLRQLRKRPLIPMYELHVTGALPRG